MKVAIYARYSTDRQDRTSIDGQIANCEALAGREGLRVVATFAVRNHWNRRRQSLPSGLTASSIDGMNGGTRGADRHETASPLVRRTAIDGVYRGAAATYPDEDTW